MQCGCTVVLHLQGPGDACSRACSLMGHPLNQEVGDRTLPGVFGADAFCEQQSEKQQECLGGFRMKVQGSFSSSSQATAPQSALNTFCMGSLPAVWLYPDSSSIKRGVMLMLDHALVAQRSPQQ